MKQKPEGPLFYISSQLSLVEERLKTTVLECERLQSVATELQSDKKAVEKKNQQVLYWDMGQ